MKNFILSMVMLFAVSSFAQEAMQIQLSDGTVVPNRARMYKHGTSLSRVITSDSIFLKNTSEATIRLKVRKTVLSASEFTANYFVALSQYVAAGENITPNYYELEAGETLSGENVLLGKFVRAGGNNPYLTGLVRYSFLSVNASGVVLDSVYIDYAYSTASLLTMDKDGQPNVAAEVMVLAQVDQKTAYPVMINNIGEAEMMVRVGGKTIHEQANDGYEFYFSYGGVMYNPTDVGDNGQGVSVAVGDTIKGDNGFVAYFDPHNMMENTKVPKVSYRFFNKATGIDGVELTLLYNVSGVGFAENETYQLSKPYPNPAADYFYIDMTLPQYSQAQLKIYNVNGQMIQQTPISQSQGRVYVSTSHLQAGIYFVNLEIDGTSIGIEKLIVK